MFLVILHAAALKPVHAELIVSGSLRRMFWSGSSFVMHYLS
jgi:hypothetical protein